MLIPDWPAPNSVFAAVTTREGGVSEGPYRSLNTATHVGDDYDCVIENRRLLKRRLRLPSEPLWLTQVHGTLAVAADSTCAGAQADAVFTSTPAVVCAIQTADCLPVLFCNTRGSKVAAAHAGWAGLLAGVLENTVASFEGGDKLLAWMGPAISQRHYEVGRELREAFLAAASDSVYDGTCNAFIPGERPGHWMTDLYQLARLRLEALGVAVYGGGFCTAADERRFFSFRRDGATGRMASLIYIKP